MADGSQNGGLITLNTPGEDGSGKTISISASQILAAIPWLRWLKPVADRIREYGSFRQAVYGFVTTYIVTGALGFGETLIAIVLQAFTPIIGAITTLGTVLIDIGRFHGQLVLDVWSTVNTALFEVAGLAGPLSPILATGITVGLVYLGYRLVLSIAGEIPVLSTVLDFTGLRP